MTPGQIAITMVAVLAGIGVLAAAILLSSWSRHQSREKEAAKFRYTDATGHLEVTQRSALFFTRVQGGDISDYPDRWEVRCLECSQRWSFGPSQELSDFPLTAADIQAHTHRAEVLR